MRIYIAGYFDARKRIKAEADKLWALGHEITSSWLYEVAKQPNMSYDDFYKKLAIKDLAEIDRADLIIVDTGDITPRGGREVELGYALGQHQKKLAFIVGPERNVFHKLADRRFDSWDEAVALLATMTTDGTAPVNDATGAPTLKEAASKTEDNRNAVR